MLKVGITGGIGSGKSTVSRIFAQLGVPVYEADSAGKWVLNEDAEVKAEIIELLGPKAYNESGLDSSWVASQVFENTDLLNQMNKVLHPAVARHFESWLADQSEASYILKEAAILFESGSAKNLDKVIVVSAPVDLRIARVVKRDGVTKAEVEKRMANQWSEEQRLSKADFIIVNDGGSAIIPQIIEIHHQLS